MHYKWTIVTVVCYFLLCLNNWYKRRYTANEVLVRGLFLLTNGGGGGRALRGSLETTNKLQRSHERSLKSSPVSLPPTSSITLFFSAASIIQFLLPNWEQKSVAANGGGWFQGMNVNASWRRIERDYMLLSERQGWVEWWCCHHWGTRLEGGECNCHWERTWLGGRCCWENGG